MTRNTNNLDLSGIPRQHRRRINRHLTAVTEHDQHLTTLTPTEQTTALQQLRTHNNNLDPAERDTPGWNIKPLAHAIHAARHTLNINPHPTQILAALVMGERCVAELATGEGKTLAVALTAATAALAGHHIHVMTANEYLAVRDANWMQPLYKHLDLTVATTTDNITVTARQRAYQANIIYGTATRFGFDYLDDNGATHAASRCQHRWDVAIVDEADALLLDDARTPLIVSGTPQPTEPIEAAATWAARLTARDVTIDHTNKTVTLTDSGLTSAETHAGVTDLYERPALAATYLAAIRAQFVYERDHDYLVTTGDNNQPQIVIIDASTGRPQPDRRWTDGLHEAIEAKEQLPVNPSPPVAATVTIPSYLERYEHLAATTATAASDDKEFEVRYDLTVCTLPTHQPCRRIDHDDLVFTDSDTKFTRLTADITELHQQNRPVLIGAPDVAGADRIAQLLTDAGLDHQVLTAKNLALEAAIIADAGAPGAITVATNMAGRGVDIRLGGDPDAAVAAAGDNPDEQDRARTRIEQARQTVIDAGGLAVIGTARHDSRRIDNQLRGRAGRQGEPGSSQFYLSLDDELLAHFATPTALAAVRRAQPAPGEPISHPALTKLVSGAQQRIVEKHRETRLQLAQMSAIADTHRNEFYEQRNDILTQPWDELVGNWLETAYRAALDDPDELVAVAREWANFPDDFDSSNLTAANIAGFCFSNTNWLDPALATAIESVLVGDHPDGVDPFDIPEHLADAAYDAFLTRHSNYLDELDNDGNTVTAGDMELVGESLRAVLLRVMDDCWTAHLADTQLLARGIGFRSAAQENWRASWVRASHDLFLALRTEYLVRGGRILTAATVTLDMPDNDTDTNTEPDQPDTLEPDAAPDAETTADRTEGTTP